MAVDTQVPAPGNQKASVVKVAYKKDNASSRPPAVRAHSRFLALGHDLGALMSLAHLWQQQGKQTKARELLFEIYNWFSEGFNTTDLQDAKALLEELG